MPEAQSKSKLVKVTTSANTIINPATEDGNLAFIKAKTDNLDVLLSTRTKPTDSQLIQFPSAFTEDNRFLSIIDYNTILSQGKIPNNPISYCIGKSGQGTILTSTYTILTNTTVTQPTINTAMKIVSTSITDSSTSTGAQQVTINYFPSTWDTAKKNRSYFNEWNYTSFSCKYRHL